MVQFRLFDIPITINPSFWVFLLFFSLDNTHPLQMVIMGSILIVSLLFHELGHAFAARRFGREPEIVIEAFGGYASYNGLGLAESKQFVITLCGPLFTALLIALPYYFLKTHLFAIYWAKLFCYCMMKLNIYWLIVNLAPLQPLDGGKIAHYLLQKYGGLRGEWFSLHLGSLAAMCGICYFTMHENFVFAMMFAMYGVKNFQASKLHPLSRASSTPFTQLNEAIKLSAEEEFEEAAKIFKKLARSKDQYIKHHATEGLALMLERIGKNQEAYQLLLKSDTDQMRKGSYLLLKLAYSQGNYELITQKAHHSYQLYPSFDMAVLNAKAYAQIGGMELAQGWLNTAKQFQEASNNWANVISDPVFTQLQESLPHR